MPVSHSPSGRIPGVLLLLGAVAGCSEWPRYANLPDAGGDVASDVDLRGLDDLFGLSWDEPDDPDVDNDVPTTAWAAELSGGDAVLVTGALDGIGWYDQATPREVSSETCGTTGDRSPVEQGDYLGDVDFYVVSPTEDATLCARALVDAPTQGWDLLLFELDACDVPTGVVQGPDDAPLGYGGGGPEGGWGHPVTAGARYGVLIAGYYPNDLEASLDYTLGLSLVASRADGSAGRCPLLPGEGDQP